MNEKNLMAKTLPTDFPVTTLETPLQVKESQVPYQRTVEPLPQYLIGLVL